MTGEALGSLLPLINYHTYSSFLILGMMLLMSPLSVSASTAKDYKEEGVSVMLAEQWYPYSFTDAHGQFGGFLVDFWKLWSNKTGVPVSFEMEPWKRTIEQVSSGHSDIHCGLFHTEARSRLLDYAQPIVALSGVLVINNELGLDCDEVLKKHAVGVPSKGYAETFMQQNNAETTRKTYLTTNLLFDALLADIVQGLAMDYGAFMHERDRRGAGDRLQLCQELYEQDLRAAVAKGNAALLQVVETGINEIEQSERERLVRKWFVEEEQATNWLAIFLTVIALALVGGLGLLWSMRRSRR